MSTPVLSIEGDQSFGFGVQCGTHPSEQFVRNRLNSDGSPPSRFHLTIDALSRGVSGDGTLHYGVHEESSSITQVHDFQFIISTSYS